MRFVWRHVILSCVVSSTFAIVNRPVSSTVGMAVEV